MDPWAAARHRRVAASPDLVWIGCRVLGVAAGLALAADRHPAPVGPAEPVAATVSR
jgi:hypothetical protein